MQLFQGSMTCRCYAETELTKGLLPGTTAPKEAIPLDPQTGVCNPDGHVAGDGECAVGVCLDYGVEPEYGGISFDSFTSAWILVFM